jgi:hypothetical protein
MTILSIADAKKNLENALDDFVKANAGSDTAVRTDYVVCASAMDYHMPTNATFYFHATSGPIHSIAGLTFMIQEEQKMLNREEALAED